ncbi:unnamed protein product, partial [Mesorhabditis belari]|uniref:Uncharacterized protein n=1 Tax=Mesorhabditis belari TaxID=2138241 RepID=A0AAF3J3A6_9BILA
MGLASTQDWFVSECGVGFGKLRQLHHFELKGVRRAGFQKTMRELIQEVVTQRKAASQRALNWAKKADKTGAANTGKKNVLSPVRGTDGSVKPQKNRNRKTKLKARHYKEMANIMLKFPEEAFEKRNGFVKQLYVCANMQWKSYENWEKKIEDYLDNHRNGDKTAVLTSKREKLEITKLRELKESLDLKFEAVNSKIDVLHEMLTKLTLAVKNDLEKLPLVCGHHVFFSHLILLC